MNFVQLRHSHYNGQNTCGIPQGDPLSMYIFCQVINQVLNQLDNDGIKFISYADDLVLKCDSPQDVQRNLDRATDLFSKIGLKINREKCESTQRGQEITFMGIKFGANCRGRPLSQKLLRVCREETDELKKYIEMGVNKNVILHFLIKSVIPSVNYGAFLDPKSEKGVYNQIDKEIVNCLFEIFKPNKDINNLEEWIQFAVAPTKASGLQLALPGFGFDLMNSTLGYEDISKGYETYQEYRTKWLQNYQQKQADDSIAIYSFKNYYQLLNDKELEFAFDQLVTHSTMQFKKKIKPPPDKETPQKCVVCGQTFTDMYHKQKCKGIQGCIKHLHDADAANLMKEISKKHTVTSCPTEMQLGHTFQTSTENFIESHHELTNKQADWVVTNEKDESRAYDYTIRDVKEIENAYKFKQTKYNTIYYGKTVIPIVVTHGLTMHTQSRKALNDLIKDNALLNKVAYRLVKGGSLRIETYNCAVSQCAEKNTEYFDKRGNQQNPNSYHDIQDQIAIEQMHANTQHVNADQDQVVADEDVAGEK
uniref:Reverse transcriptase, putative n=1 Tax=Trepomonas sp. PC1 TaxID=1076344 RepID=A0A146K9V8_9EUKA|eukprot:JAP92306.1 Reverse transcriptase, putative [Trepomonas sp. PC1]